MWARSPKKIKNKLIRKKYNPKDANKTWKKTREERHAYMSLSSNIHQHCQETSTFLDHLPIKNKHIENLLSAPRERIENTLELYANLEEDIEDAEKRLATAKQPHTHPQTDLIAELEKNVSAAKDNYWHGNKSINLQKERKKQQTLLTKKTKSELAKEAEMKRLLELQNEEEEEDEDLMFHTLRLRKRASETMRTTVHLTDRTKRKQQDDKKISSTSSSISSYEKMMKDKRRRDKAKEGVRNFTTRKKMALREKRASSALSNMPHRLLLWLYGLYVTKKTSQASNVNVEVESRRIFYIIIFIILHVTSV